MTNRTAPSGAAAGIVVGRAEEVALVRGLVDRGEPAVILFEGEAGIGKSTLLDVAFRRARRAGHTVVSGVADDLYGTRPLGLLADAFGATASSPGVDDVRHALIGELERLANGAIHGQGGATAPLFGAVVDPVPILVDRCLDLLEQLALAGPVLVALDDLQWTDRTTLAVLGALVLRTRGLDVRFVLARRPLSGDDLLERAVGRANGPDVVLRRIGPLSDGEVERLAQMLRPDAVGSLPRDLAQRAGGNPFFVRELVERSGEDFTDLVRARLRGAGDRASELLRAAAVVGPGVEPDDLALLVERPLGEVLEILSEASTAGFLVDDERGLRFRHDLVREALIAQTPARVQRALHRRVAIVLAERDAAPEVVAGHLLAGAEDGDRRTIASLREVVRGCSPVVVADVLHRALERCHPHDPQRAQLAAEAAHALLFAGRPVDAVRVTGEALEAMPPADVAYSLRTARSHALFALGDPAAAVAQWLDTRRLDPRAATPDESAETSLARLFAGDTAGARADAHVALANPEAVTPLSLSTAHAVLAWLDAAAADIPGALAHVDAAEAVLPASDYGGGSPYGTSIVAAAVADAAGLDERARAAIRAAHRQVGDFGYSVLEPLVYAVEAVHELRNGDWSSALAAAEAGRTATLESGVRLAANWLAAVAALVTIDRGDHASAAVVLDELAEPAVLLGLDWLALARARLTVVADPVAALDGLAAITRLYVEAGARSCLAHLAPDLARLSLEVGDEQHGTWLRHAIDGLPPTVPPPMAGAVAAAAATLDRDPRAVLRAADMLDGCGRRAEAARSRAWAAAELADHDPAAARDAAKAAVAAFDAMGAVAPAGALRASLRSRGVRFRTSDPGRPTVGWEALTPAESQIVELVALGLTNAAIAERLVVSRRTVESHLVRVYRKLGISSRVELARHALERSRSSGAAEPHRPA